MQQMCSPYTYFHFAETLCGGVCSVGTGRSFSSFSLYLLFYYGEIVVSYNENKRHIHKIKIKL